MTWAPGHARHVALSGARGGSAGSPPGSPAPTQNTPSYTPLQLLTSGELQKCPGTKNLTRHEAQNQTAEFILFPFNSAVAIAAALVLLLLIPSIINTLQDLG